MQKILSFFIFFFLTKFSFSQFLNRNADTLFYKYKKEIFMSGGFAQFSRNLSGFEIEQFVNYPRFNIYGTNLVLNAGFQFHYKPLFATTTQLNVFKFQQADYLQTLASRATRKIDLNAAFIDLSQRIELVYFSKYNRSYKRDKQKYKRFELYTFTGFGGVFFKTKANINSEYITRGFGKNFNNLSFFIPSGFGLQKSISNSSSLKFELIYSIPFSNYSFKINPENCETWSTEKNDYFDYCNFKFPDNFDFYVSANFSFAKALGVKEKN